MNKYLYFQTATGIDGTDTDEEAIMVPADSLIAIEAGAADEDKLWMHFAGKGIGDVDAATDVISVKLSVTEENFQEFCRQIAKFINADVLNRDNSAYSKDGFLVVACSLSGSVSYFHSSVTACDLIQIKTAAA
tara:strand:- start:864 stop:1262 length:399 start_codon:yes stop_codon:yes gene_type:complete